jgi:hypothetical protein
MDEIELGIERKIMMPIEKNLLSNGFAKFGTV